MSETILTKSWPLPKNTCDICKTNPATRWFGDTSVAICNDDNCYTETKRQWDEMLTRLRNGDD